MKVENSRWNSPLPVQNLKLPAEGFAYAPRTADDRQNASPRDVRRHRRLREPHPAFLPIGGRRGARSEEHTSELQSLTNLVCRLLLEKKKKNKNKDKIRDPNRHKRNRTS